MTLETGADDDLTGQRPVDRDNIQVAPSTGRRAPGALWRGVTRYWASASSGELELEADPTGRLSAYVAKSHVTLDLLALCTIWLVVVPPSRFGSLSDVVLGLRVSLSVVYLVDLTIRARLARRHLHYVVHHPLSVAAVVLPPVRVVFSLRLVSSLFRRRHLPLFLLAASVLALNGAAVVYFYERHAPGGNIHNFGEAVWFAITTVTTVGYGDYTPVTTPGRVAAVFIMVIGVLVLALITANIASSFFMAGGKDAEKDDEDSSGSKGGDGTEVSASQMQALLESMGQLQDQLTRLEARLPAALPSTDIRSSADTGSAPTEANDPSEPGPGAGH